MKIRFLGAARRVTGSQFLLDTGQDFRLLVECGLTMEKHPEGEAPTDSEGQGVFSYDPTMINAVALTHAHLDHSGNLPNLVKEGFEGPIYCTEPTADLTELLLFDAASLNRRKFQALQKKSKKKARPDANEVAGFYFERQVKETLDQFKYARFGQEFRIADHVRIKFLPAGHLLGAAHIIVTVEKPDGTETKVGFSGDVGRWGYPLLVDPGEMEQVDYLLSECTYGNREHEDDDPLPILEQIVKETCIDKPGRLIIPAFSIGRTQAILYTLNRLYEEKGFEPITVFSDSPLAMQSTKVYRKYKRYLNEEARAFEQTHDDLFDFEGLEYVENMKDSEAINNYSQPSIIISSSGMIQGGRIEHHIKRNLSNPYATIFLVGYAAEGTFGHRLRNHSNGAIRFGGKDYQVDCTVRHTDAFSGHADREDLLRFLYQQDKTKLKGLFLVHGDLSNMEPFAEDLKEEGWQVVIPALGEEVELN